MLTSVPRPSAKLYVFPTRMDAGAAEYRPAGKPGADRKVQPLAPVEFGSGWYHEAAVRDAEREAQGMPVVR